MRHLRIIQGDQTTAITGTTNVASHEVDPANVEWVFRVNSFGSFHTTRAVPPGMVRQNYGRIPRIASIASKEGNAGMMACSASMAAVIGRTKTQGKELAETGVTVNARSPAVIRTPMVDAMPPARNTEVLNLSAEIQGQQPGNLAGSDIAT